MRPYIEECRKFPLVKEAANIAEKLKTAAGRITIGPAEKGTEISISCGIASLVCMPQGLDRGIAAAELACKTAKNRGRDRVEIYACDDNSMMRRYDDAIAIGQLRGALKTDRLMLYAQLITPLRNKSLPCGYEILLRMRGEDGKLVMPGPFDRCSIPLSIASHGGSLGYQACPGNVGSLSWDVELPWHRNFD